MIRICHVQVLSLMSGVQRSMLEIFKQLDRTRFEIHVACQGPGPLTEELDRQRIRWHAIPALDRPIHPWRDWQAYRQLHRLFRDQQFDIVHTHSSKPGILGRVAARRAGVPHVVHHVRGFAFHEFSPLAKRWLYSRLESWAGRFCDRVLFVNHEEREMAVRQGWLPAAKCETVYNGVQLSSVDAPDVTGARHPLRQSWGATQDDVVILFAGRFEPQKQPHLLPSIADRLRTRATNHPWRLIIAGSGPCEEALRADVSRLGLRDQVAVVGWLDEPLKAYAAADMVLLPSLFEGLPRVLIEAQAAALPTVASDVKGNREVVTAETGFLCPPHDPQAFADKLAQLVDDPLQRARLGRAARQRAEEHFDTVVNHRRIARLYEELLGTQAPAIRRAA